MSVAIVCMTNDPNNTLPVNGTEDNSTVTVYTGSSCPDLGADGENKKVRNTSIGAYSVYGQWVHLFLKF